MMSKIKRYRFLCCFICAFCTCILLTIYCIINGQAMASTHREPHYLIAVMQSLTAVILAIFLCSNKHSRKIKWFSVPIMLFIFAIIYVILVAQHTCCIGG